jgi:tetratricopeptide (TPR) repeat protein
MEEDACAICLSEPMVNPKVLATCGHSFCKACIEHLVLCGGGETCPLCRVSLPDSADKAFIEAATLMIRRERQQPLTSPVDDGEIRRTLERALALDPHHTGALVTLGETLCDQEPARAQNLLCTAIAESTEPIPAAHMALGSAMGNLGNFEGSVVELRKAIQLAKELGHTIILSNAHMNLAMTYEGMGDFQQSMREYEAAMKVDPTDYLIPFNMGVTLAQQDDTVNSIEAYKKALALEPLFFDCNLALANAYQQRIIETKNDNSFRAGYERGETAQRWLAAALRAEATASSPADLRDCKEHIDKIQKYFPNVWAIYQLRGDAAVMALM